MKPNCERIRETLAAEGPRALRDDEAAQQHVAECEGCFRFLESLTEIEEGLGSLATFDAPEHVVEALLARPEIVAGAAPVARPTRWQRLRSALASPPRPRPLVWSSLAAASLMVVFAIGLRNLGPAYEPLAVLAELDSKDVQERKNETAVSELQGALRRDEVEAAVRRRMAGDDAAGPMEPEPALQPAAEVGAKIDAEAVGGDADKSRFTDAFINDLPVPGRFYQEVLTQAPGVQDPDGDGNASVHGSRSRDFQTVVDGASNVDPLKGREAGQISSNSIEEMEVITAGEGVEFRRAQGGLADLREADAKEKGSAKPAAPALAGAGGVTEPVPIESSRVRPAYPELARNARVEARVILQVVVRADGTVAGARVLNCDRPGLGFEESATQAVEQWRFEPARQGDRPVDVYWTVTIDFDPDATEDAGPGSGLMQDDDAVRLARAYLDQRRSTAGLAFQPASGYWSNSYVPGDSTLRLLGARLAGWDRAPLAAHFPAAPLLHDASRRVGQPFDAPDASALAVYLHADRRGLTGEGRLLVQVGIEGAPRHGGRRPAMNVALVLDLREALSTELAIGVRSLLEAFNRAKEPGDRFRLLVAGRPGGCIVEPDDFRHGSLRVALDRLIDGPATGGLDLAGALREAIERIAGEGDDEAPLGSNAVFLITGGALGEATNGLVGLAHQGAIAGIPLSVIGVGPGVDPAEIERLTLAGQGSRRMLADAAGAADLVERELAAAGRAVARAVRLRVRLAPGVKLVGVLGSERLDETRAQRVREAERSLDLRLARHLGIQADRGEDEEGIQIVIPSFYAGDAHAILLDVVAPGRGPIAEVTVRYKDLVRLQNGVARASLALGDDARPAGPLERNVLKNELSLHSSRKLDEAGRALRAGDATRAAALLDDLTALLEGLRRELPGLDGDPDLLRDLAMLAEYRTLLARGTAVQPEQRAFLADSLRYAARLKLLPPPVETLS